MDSIGHFDPARDYDETEVRYARDTFDRGFVSKWCLKGHAISHVRWVYRREDVVLHYVFMFFGLLSSVSSHWKSAARKTGISYPGFRCLCVF